VFKAEFKEFKLINSRLVIVHEAYEYQDKLLDNFAMLD